MRILLTGSDGQVGREVRLQAPYHHIDILSTDRRTLDLTQPQSIARIFEGNRFDLVINTAAYTQVDQAESEPDLARATNEEGVRLLAEHCATRDIRLFHISTDYVFDGTSTRPYREDDPTNPLSVYGSTKLAGEEGVRNNLDKHLILRTSWVFGTQGNNFVTSILRLAAERDEINVVADQIGCPTFAGSIADALLRLAMEENAVGTFHFCNAGATTRHAFASRIVELAAAQGLLKSIPRVVPVTTANYPTRSQRPLYSVLNCDRFRSCFPGIAIEQWEDGVTRTIHSLRTTQ